MKYVFVAVLVLLLAASAAMAEPTVWYVHPDSSLNSIQAALDSCADNDIVLVAPGTYVENIVWPNMQGIQLISTMGAEQTIIDGDSTASVVTVSVSVDSTTIITGFTMQNGFGNYGGGLFVSGASPIISSNIIVGNVANFGGGGIYCVSNALPLIRNNTITGNTVINRLGGGIACMGASPTILGNTITYNTAEGATNTNGVGGGILCYNSTATIAGNTISYNTATGTYGQGAGICCDHASPIIRYNTIEANTPTYEGGGVMIYQSSPRLTRNSIINNNGMYGAGIHCCTNSNPIIDSCIIADNNGIGVCCHDSGLAEIHYCCIENNASYGVQNFTPSDTINAEYNWWGDPSGPGGYGPGSGDEVSLWVDYDPWLTYDPLGVAEELPVIQPRELEMSCEPNPFATSTTIHLAGMAYGARRIEFEIFDVSGRRVRDFILYPSSFILPASLEWDGKDSRGQQVMPGVYFVRCEAGDEAIVRKVVRLK